jgi:uncharacterized iron-regulated membrane protein
MQDQHRPPNAFQKWLDRPQNLRFRQAIFQIHLWVGIGIGLYVLLIGVTGAALVFRDEMENGFAAHLHASHAAAPPAQDLLALADSVRARHPDRILTSIRNPTPEEPFVRAYLRKGEDYLAVNLDPRDGALLATQDSGSSFLRWLQLLHFDLLAGRTGRIVNGVGALFLLLLCLSGLVIWWPGLKNWKRSLAVDFSKKWKRVNWDLHSATGFWSVAVIAMWAVTGAYFAWPSEFRRLVNFFSPVSLAKVSTPDPANKGKFPPPDLRQLIAHAQSLSPRTTLLSLSFPADDKGHFRVYLARETPAAYESADYHYFDPFTGRHLTVWRRGLNQSAGDIVMSWIGPLHFGTFGGLGAAGIAVKAFWLILGLAPPLLMVTGFLMYWNRFLSKRWAKLKNPTRREGYSEAAAL